MDSFEARRISKKGLIYAVIGTLTGLAFGQGGIGFALMLGYAFWALYHGVQLVQPLARRHFDFGPVHLSTHSIPELFYKATLLKLLKVIVPLGLGYVVGAFGGAILRQLYLFGKMANN